MDIKYSSVCVYIFRSGIRLQKAHPIFVHASDTKTRAMKHVETDALKNQHLGNQNAHGEHATDVHNAPVSGACLFHGSNCSRHPFLIHAVCLISYTHLTTVDNMPVQQQRVVQVKEMQSGTIMCMFI